MQEQQVDIVRLQIFQRLQDRLLCIFIGFEIHLGDEKQFFAVHAAGLDARAHFFFIAVGFGCVDHPIAAFDGGRNRLRAGLAAEHKGAKADQRHLHAIVQSQVFHIPSSVSAFTALGLLCYNHCNKFE